jgi:hypothetical protein
MTTRSGRARRCAARPLALAAALLAAAVGPAATAHAQERGWAPGVHCVPGVNGEALDAVYFDDGSGEALYVAGDFTIAGCVDAGGVARWDGSAWSAVGEPFRSIDRPEEVKALAVYDDGSGPALYAGGWFSDIGDERVFYVARWGGERWEALPDGGLGDPGQVNTLAVLDVGDGPMLYAGTTRGVSRWDGAAWRSITAAIDGDVEALAVFERNGGRQLFAAGDFASVGGTLAANIACWDGTSWHPLGAGLDRRAYALAVYDDGTGAALYAGGQFDAAGGAPAVGVARWDGSAWSALPGTESITQATSLAVHDDGSGPKLYVAGSIGTGPWGNATLARWDGASWDAPAGRMNNHVRYVESFGDHLLFGGWFRWAWDAPVLGASCVVKLEDGVVIALGEGITGRIQDLAAYDDGSGPALYAAGLVFDAGGASRLVKRVGDRWRAVPGDFGFGEPGIMLAAGDGRLIVSGGFSAIGGVQARNIAAWDGSAWSALGDGIDGRILALAEFRGELYAAGVFEQSDGTVFSHIARFDGETWNPVGGGLTLADCPLPWPFECAPGVGSLAVHDDGTGPALYAGGSFDHAGGQPAANIARWDGEGWSALGEGLGVPPRGVNALAVYDTGDGERLLAADSGDFTRPPAVMLWDGLGWDFTGSPSELSVRDMVVVDGARFGRDGDVIVAVGREQGAGADPQAIAIWDGAGWDSTTLGVAGDLSEADAVAAVPGGAIFVAGAFLYAGEAVSSIIAEWRASCRADLDGDGELTIFDFLAFQNAFDAMDPVADFDGDGAFTIFDFLAFQNAFDAGC